MASSLFTVVYLHEQLSVFILLFIILLCKKVTLLLSYYIYNYKFYYNYNINKFIFQMCLHKDKIEI